MALVQTVIKRDRRGRRQIFVPVDSTIHDVAKVVDLNRMLFIWMPSIFTPETYEEIDYVLNRFREQGVPEVVIHQDGHLVYFSDSTYHDAIEQSPFSWVFDSKVKCFQPVSEPSCTQRQA
jgi:hypothetical protein